MKVALVYDRVNKIGGAEKILIALHKLYPQAPLFTLVYDPEGAPWAKNFVIKTSFLQKIPLARKFHEFFPILPIFAFEQFDFREFDVVISVTSTEAKGIITHPHTLHISYILTPTRYLWSHFFDYFSNPVLRFFASPIVSCLRTWDMVSAQKPDKIVAISRTVRKRVNKYYHRDADVIYPPVKKHTPIFKNQNVTIQSVVKDKDFFLVVSRLVKYKKIDIAIAACNTLQLPLKIVGDGMERKYLEKIAGPTIEFLGNLTDAELSDYYQNCRGLLFPQEEDFGITAVEALCYGKPVVAYAKGGATEFVRSGKNGELFAPQTKEALMYTLARFLKKQYSQSFCVKSAEKYELKSFLKQFRDMVQTEYVKHKNKL